MVLRGDIMNYILPADRNQTVLFNSLESIIPKVHPVRLIDKIVSNIVLHNLEKFKYKGQQKVGRPSYSPETMLKLYIYGYLNSISSSRKLETETQRNIELKWLLGDLQPDFKTIADYRKDNGDQIRRVTVEFRKFLKENGYIRGKHVAIDGCKVKANAKREMLNIDKIEQKLHNLDEELSKYLNCLERADIDEDLSEEIESTCSGSVDQHLKEKIILLQSKILVLEKQKKELQSSNIKYLSATDKDARLMKSRDGKIPAYNVETVVDAEYHMIAEAQATTSPNDLKELGPVLESLKENLELEPSEASADKGFYNPTEIRRLEDELRTRFYIPWQSTKNDKSKINFIYDEEHDEYLCPNGKRLKLIQKHKQRGNSFADVYQCLECDGCSYRPDCTNSKKGRMLHRYHDHDWREHYKVRVKSDYGKEMVKKRKEIVEHVFGTIKCWMGKIPLLLRSLEKVQIEIDLYATAYNLKRLMNIVPFSKVMEMVNNYDWKLEKVKLISSIFDFFRNLIFPWNFSSSNQHKLSSLYKLDLCFSHSLFNCGIK